MLAIVYPPVVKNANAQAECPPNPAPGQICEDDECDGDCSQDGSGDSDANPGDLDDIGNFGGGCSVTETPEGGNGTTCTYYCNDDQLGFMYLEDEGVWAVDGGLSVINGENDFTIVNGVPICSWALAGEAPCTTITITPSGEITCGGNFSVTASASVPCMTVLRDPYPRGLVSVPNLFWINGPWSSIGSASSREWCTPTIRNYTLRIGWQFLPIVPPIWQFDDRAWSDGGQSALGFAVAHIYETSSWGLPANGPSLEGRLDIPAYQVRLGTSWQAVVRRTWEELEKGGRKTFDCDAGDTECLDLYTMCVDPATDPDHDNCFEWSWVFHDTGWIPVDLTLYGYPEPYYLSWAAGDVTMPPPGIAVVPLGQRLCNVPVPIIEAQSLLNSPGNTP
jgi:hypothetical protein